MMGVEAAETCWATNKRQVINLWNRCIWLVNLSELKWISCWFIKRQKHIAVVTSSANSTIPTDHLKLKAPVRFRIHGTPSEYCRHYGTNSLIQNEGFVMNSFPTSLRHVGNKTKQNTNLHMLPKLLLQLFASQKQRHAASASCICHTSGLIWYTVQNSIKRCLSYDYRSHKFSHLHIPRFCRATPD